MRTRVLGTIAAALLLGVGAVAPPSSAAPAGFIATPNGLVGVAQEIVIYAPQMAGQPATIGLTSGATQTVLQTPVNAQGYGYANWTPTAAGSWTVNGLGTAVSAGSTTISVSAMPTIAILEAPNNVQVNVGTPVIASVTAPGGTLAPTGTITMRDAATQNIIATGTLNPVGTSTTSIATIIWTATSSGQAALVANYSPATNAFQSSTSDITRPVVSTALPNVALAFPPTLYVGQPTVLTAVLGANQPAGSVAFLFDGQGFAGSVPTTNGLANQVWIPQAAGVHTIGVNYSAAPPSTVSGSSFQPVTIQGPLPQDSITVDPQPGAPWFIASPITLQAGTSVTLSGVAASGAPVVLSESGPCTLSGAILRALSGGQCQVTAYSPGSATYRSVSQTYTVTVAAPARTRR